jgi:hypothetical protein
MGVQPPILKPVPWGLVCRSQRFGEGFCFHLQGWSNEPGLGGTIYMAAGGGSLEERANRDEWGRDSSGPMRRLQAGVRRGEGSRTDEVSSIRAHWAGQILWNETCLRSFRSRMTMLPCPTQRETVFPLHAVRLELNSIGSGPCVSSSSPE